MDEGHLGKWAQAAGTADHLSPAWHPSASCHAGTRRCELSVRMHDCETRPACGTRLHLCSFTLCTPVCCWRVAGKGTAGGLQRTAVGERAFKHRLIALGTQGCLGDVKRLPGNQPECRLFGIGLTLHLP